MNENHLDMSSVRKYILYNMIIIKNNSISLGILKIYNMVVGIDHLLRHELYVDLKEMALNDQLWHNA